MSCKLELNHLKHMGPFHFVGICGSGMAPLACLGKQKGLHIEGSDLKSSDYHVAFEELGIHVNDFHHESHVSLANTVVVSSAITSSNIEWLSAKRHNKRILHRSEFLKLLSDLNQCIAVSGSHGKTTTTAMISFLLKESHVPLDAVVGGVMKDYDSPYLASEDSMYTVIEADESDGSFLQYQPSIAVVTNIESDHLDHFQSYENLERAFLDFLDGMVVNGSIVVNMDRVSKKVLDHMGHLNTIYISIFSEQADLFCRKLDDGQLMLVWKQGLNGVKFSPKLIGEHNIENYLCALAVGLVIGLDIHSAVKVLEDFSGVERRLDRLCYSEKLSVYDDYAHNPGKIQACIRALKSHYPDSMVTVIFQPHRYSRLSTLYDEFKSAFKGADRVYVTPIYAAGEAEPSKNINISNLCDDIQGDSGVFCAPFSTDHLLKCLHDTMGHVVCVTVGAGDVNRIAHDLKSLAI